MKQYLFRGYVSSAVTTGHMKRIALGGTTWDKEYEETTW